MINAIAYLQTQTETEDAPGIDPAANATEESKELLEALLEAIPRIAIGLVIIALAYIAVVVVRKYVQPRLKRRRTESFGRVITKLINWGLMFSAVLAAAVVIFPSVDPVSILGGLGIFSIAVGFAFQDILSNLLAGVLLLIRQPFESGDQIEVSGQRGTVQAITIRETQIKTFDGEKVIIPNAEVYQNVIRVQTAFGPKRSVLTIGLDDWEDLDAAADVVLDAVRDVEGVESDPEPEAFFFEFGDSTTNLQLRYWTRPEQHQVRQVTDGVVRAVGRALKDKKISMPSPIRELEARDSLSAALGASDNDNDNDNEHAMSAIG